MSSAAWIVMKWKGCMGSMPFCVVEMYSERSDR